MYTQSFSSRVNIVGRKLWYSLEWRCRLLILKAHQLRFATPTLLRLFAASQQNLDDWRITSTSAHFAWFHVLMLITFRAKLTHQGKLTHQARQGPDSRRGRARRTSHREVNELWNEMYFFARSPHPAKYQLTRLMNFTLPSITCGHNGLLPVLIELVWRKRTGGHSCRLCTVLSWVIHR